MSTTEWLVLLGSIGEFAIAGVIYYELEENRASTFLANVQNPDFLKKTGGHCTKPMSPLRNRARRSKLALRHSKTK